MLWIMLFGTLSSAPISAHARSHDQQSTSSTSVYLAEMMWLAVCWPYTLLQDDQCGRSGSAAARHLKSSFPKATLKSDSSEIGGRRTGGGGGVWGRTWTALSQRRP